MGFSCIPSLRPLVAWCWFFAGMSVCTLVSVVFFRCWRSSIQTSACLSIRLQDTDAGVVFAVQGSSERSCRGISRWCCWCGKFARRWRWGIPWFWSQRRTRDWARCCLPRYVPRLVFQPECSTSWPDPELWAACLPDIATSTKLPLPDLPRSRSCYCYPHMPIGKLWIYHLLFVFCCCNFVCLYGCGFLRRG